MAIYEWKNGEKAFVTSGETKGLVADRREVVYLINFSIIVVDYLGIS